MLSVGILKLSSIHIHKTNNKISKECIDIITGEKLQVKTNSIFDKEDKYIVYNKTYGTIENSVGIVNNYSDDLDIFNYLYTYKWLGERPYSNLKINYDVDLIPNRIFYENKVITVDPFGSEDLDDGFTLSEDDTHYYLDIHIADPTSYKIPEIMWNEIMLRQSTCYIPNIKNNKNIRNLLPKKFVELVTLKGDKPRRAISFCFTIHKENHKISYEMKNTILTNITNYTYDEYQDTHSDICNKLNHIMKRSNKISDSHDMIETFMIFTNWYVGNRIKEPIYRVQNNVSDNELLNYLFTRTATYSTNEKFHATLNLEGYCHVTSPMRRVVDMLNHYKLRNIHKEFDISEINYVTSYQRKLSNTYKIIMLLEKDNVFKCRIYENYLVLESINNSNIKKIMYDYPSIIDLETYKDKEFIVELHYVPSNFKSNKFPFKIKFL